MKPLRTAHPNLEIALVLAILLSMVSPLWAKCPTHSVEVRGKIECTFEPDDRVLATLIFSDHQPEAFAEETAIDIHDGTFAGRVAFSTYSSSNLLSEDVCRRHPKSIIIRLIRADGIEKDRTTLKIVSDFKYDEKLGKYILLSDVILHGWCQPKCDQAISAPCQSQN
jgi:hypothetical protein